jgi:carboxypeptidase family protein
MFVGHYGVSFAVQTINRQIPLWVLFIAVQLLDVMWAPLILLGIEKVRIVPGITASNPLDLYYMPYTHSLIAAVAWSAAGWALYRAWRVRCALGSSSPCDVEANDMRAVAPVVAAGLLIAFSVPAAQVESRLLGRVADRCGAPLPGVAIAVNGDSHRVVVQTDGEGRFDVRSLPAGVYAVSGRLAGFVTINRSGLNIVAGSTTRLDLTMEIGLFDPITIVADPRSAYRGASAVVHLRIVESLIASLKAGRPTTEHRAAIIAVVKPFKEKPRPVWRTPPPTERITPFSTFWVLQGDSGSIRHGDRSVTGERTPARAGDEYVAFLEDSCQRLWGLMLIFPVRNGRVSVPKDEPGYSAEWDRYDGVPVRTFIGELKKFGD